MTPTAETPTLGRLDPRADHGFHRRSVLRAVAGEPVMAVAIQRILVMDVAHPSVGAGVRDHSQFRQLPYRRLVATADAALRLVFGDASVARAAARQVYRVHDHIHGEIGEAGPTRPGDASYTAHDATLLLWVWATIVDSIEVAFTRWVRPFRPGEADALYADLLSFASFFGIPEGMVPPDRPAFATYLDAMLDSDELAWTATSAAMVRDVLWYRHPLVPAPLVRPLRVMAVGTLDPRLRERYALTLSRNDQRLFERLDRTLAGWYGHLPALRTRLPEVYLLLRRPPRHTLP